jgi:hypothetical protein
MSIRREFASLVLAAPQIVRGRERGVGQSVAIYGASAEVAGFIHDLSSVWNPLGLSFYLLRRENRLLGRPFANPGALVAERRSKLR